MHGPSGGGADGRPRSVDRPEPWLAALAWASCGYVAALVGLALDHAVGGAPAGNALGVGLHLQKLALCSGAPLGLGLGALVSFARRRRRGVLALAAALAMPPSFAVARSLADGEGVADGPLPVVAVVAIGTVLFVSIATLGVLLSAVRRTLLGSTTAVSLAVALAFLAGLGAQTYRHASLLAAANATLCLAGVLARFAFAGRMRLRTIGALPLLALGVALVSPFAAARALEDGRRSIQLAMGVGSGLDALIVAPEPIVVRRIRFDVRGIDASRCPELPALSPERSSSRFRNLLLVSIDSLRRDVIGSRAGGRPITPHVEALERVSVVPERAYTTYPATFFAVAGAFTGLSPSRILLAPEPPRSLLSSLATEIERTVAVIPDARYFHRDDFRRYVLQDVAYVSGPDAQAQVDAALGVIREARASEQRFAVWVHLYEPHHRYVPHPGFDFGSSDRERYLGEVAYADTALGRLLETSRAEGALDDTLVIFFADHGEALGERGWFGHHVFLNRWIAEIPMALLVPGLGAQTTPGVAAVIDVAPTALDALGIARPHPMEGRDLLGPPDPDRPIVAESFSTGGPWLARFGSTRVHDVAELGRRVELYNRAFDRYPGSVSLTQGRYRLIAWRASGIVQLFDFVSDPMERADLYRARPDVRERMLETLERWHRQQSRAIRCTLAPSSDARP